MITEPTILSNLFSELDYKSNSSWEIISDLLPLIIAFEFYISVCLAKDFAPNFDRLVGFTDLLSTSHIFSKSA